MHSKNQYINIVIVFITALISSYTTGVILSNLFPRSGSFFYLIAWLLLFLVVYKVVNFIVALLFGKHKNYLEIQKRYLNRIVGLINRKNENT